MNTMSNRSSVIVRLRCSNGSVGVGEGTTIGGMSDGIEVASTLASGSIEIDIEEAEQRHRLFKIKIFKRSLQDDVTHVAAVKRAVGARASVRIDVNQAWTCLEARRGLDGLEDAGIDLVEQPVRFRR